VAIALREGTPSEALASLEQLLAIEDPFSDDFERIDFGDWASIHVYLPQPDVDSSITPPFMEAFLEIQKQLYQLAAQAASGSPDSGHLSDEMKRRLQISVVVSGGSSDYVTKFSKPAQELLKTMVGKMTGKQAAIVILGTVFLIGSGWSFNAWLEQRKAIQIEELKSKDHIEALKALTLNGAAQLETMNKIISIVEKQGDIGKRAIEAVTATNDAILKAASKTPQTVVNDIHLSQQEADLLRASPRKKAEVRIVIQRMRVLDINSSDPNELSILIATPDKKTQYRIKFTDSLFGQDDRRRLIEALDNRESIWMELAFKEVDGDVRSAELIKTTGPPKAAAAVED